MPSLDEATKKRIAPAVIRQNAVGAGGSRRRAVGGVPVGATRIGGVVVDAVIDTGSQVTTLHQSFYERHLAKMPINTTEAAEYNLTAANGGLMPLVGCVTTEVSFQGQTLPNVVIMIVKDPPIPQQQPCLLGTNVLECIPSFAHIFPPKQFPQDITSYIHTRRVCTVLPPQTVTSIIATGVVLTTETAVLIEPAQTPIKAGCFLLPSMSVTKNGQVTVLLVNATEEEVILPRRTKIGRLSTGVGVTNCQTVRVTEKDGVLVLGKDEAQDIKADVGPDLKPAESDSLSTLVNKYRHLFAFKDSQLGYTDRVRHTIPLTSDVPIKQPYRRIPPAALEEVRDHIQNLLRQGIIQPSASSFASPIVVIRKKSGELRLCVDYRRLNDITRKDSFPLPRIDETLDAIGGAKFFTSLDLASGYHQVAMDPDCQHKTAFTCPWGLYEFTRMPFGLCNSPATFQRLMTSTMSDFIFKILLVYLDDILVFSNTFEDHLSSLEKVFQRLEQINVKLNPEKCEFAKTEVAFLGHRVSAQGIRTDPDKITAVMDWKTPQTTKDVRSFLGLASYYRRFVDKFAHIAKPLHNIVSKIHNRNPKCQSKNKKIAQTAKNSTERQPLGDLWTPACAEAFLKLKIALTTAPVLGYADYSLDFILEVDASKDGLGAVLSQQQAAGSRVIAYASRALKPAETTEINKNYSSQKLELAAMKWSITDKFRGYLMGHFFTLYTDNGPLSHWKNAKFGAVEQRWIGEIESGFTFATKFRSGRVNRNADALSRNPIETTDAREPDEWIAVSQIREAQDEQPSAINIATELESCQVRAVTVLPDPQPPRCLEPLSSADLIQEQARDQDIHPILRHVQNHTRPNVEEQQSYSRSAKTLLRHLPSLKMDNGILKKTLHTQEQLPVDVIVLPSSLKQIVFTKAHTECGHQGRDRTTKLLQSRCFWPNMSAEIADLVKNCIRCLKSHGTKTVFQPKGHLNATQPLEIVALDFVTLDRAADGTENVLVMSDIFSKYTVAIPTRDQTALTTVKTLLQSWTPYLGMPLRIHSDKGKSFDAEVTRLLCEHYNIKRTRTTSYHPQGNGQVERFNRSMIQMLTSLEADKKSRWPEYLPELVFCYNATPHTTTGHSPYSLLFGREPTLPVDVFLNVAKPSSSTDYIAQHLQRLDEMREKARVAVKKALQRQDAASSSNKKPIHLKIGDFVLKRQHPAGRKKLQDAFGGPPLRVVGLPPSTGGPFVVRPPLGPDQRVSSAELKRIPPGALLPTPAPVVNQPPAPARPRARLGPSINKYYHLAFPPSAHIIPPVQPTIPPLVQPVAPPELHRSAVRIPAQPAQPAIPVAAQPLRILAQRPPPALQPQAIPAPVQPDRAGRIPPPRRSSRLATRNTNPEYRSTWR